MKSNNCTQELHMLDQDIHNQIATLNSLNIHDHPIIDTRSLGSPLFPENTAFTPQLSDIHLLRNNTNRSTTPDILMRHPLQQHDEIAHQLIRRESYPNLHGYSAYWNDLQFAPEQQQASNLSFMQSSSLRKHSVDTLKRFDYFKSSINRLSPSYSNPDLSTARRLASVDSGIPRSNLTKYGNMDYNTQLMAPHFMRQTSSRPPSPPSRKSSIGIQRRASSTSMMDDARFASLNLEDMKDDIYLICKDQNGCRYLQKKLEETDLQQREVIFNQVYPHFVELMTGKYLQNNLDEQVRSSFTLIKDINGNHVIQKCLHRFTTKHKQFIYDAVSENCIEVATHRHGCCVLQRCIDYSANNQTKQLVDEIINHALTLVQDPYGNYVVQYVLELGDAQFSNRLIRQFIGNLSKLSTQKYSSNVMEKCIRVAEEDTRHDLVQEMMNKDRLEKLLKDSYANYVVQTALDYASESQHRQLAEYIRPLLPTIRNTSYCKRIQA
ncbi:hypothetical protein RO3G_06329 [Rhizopus delemar RA 99-880]|uniref:PUM-HD domain-containing protein n=1 Tax=Rhizopus delemar (strain RA 99-880 / ATCC MYA-4621 / FGSC 9543 / NRRL 43880) TaxID=246409 RepID=I1BZJ4_RHIO9|nr:hypothetical protein RO3G_06329 [Rhizopus delemar RA 99-880]|eukprot:EIE81624.1 hypothetical protein RO3G_06329 [Rhizopus delemar RA 99-880]